MRATNDLEMDTPTGGSRTAPVRYWQHTRPFHRGCTVVPKTRSEITRAMTIRTNTVSRTPFGARSFFGGPQRLFDKADDGSPGGAVDPPTAPFTKEQQEALDLAVNATVNRALSTHLGRVLPKAIEAAMAKSAPKS